MALGLAVAMRPHSVQRLQPLRIGRITKVYPHFQTPQLALATKDVKMPPAPLASTPYAKVHSRVLTRRPKDHRPVATITTNLGNERILRRSRISIDGTDINNSHVARPYLTSVPHLSY